MNQWRHGTKPVIGLIGGIGAGKSTAGRFFQQKGGKIVDADAIGHAALGQDEIIGKIVSRWGAKTVKEDGSLDRRVIASIVFANPEERSALEGMVFPYIGERCQEEIQRAQSDLNVRFVVLDAAVMLEAGWNEVADRIVYLDAPRELRLERVAKRNGWTDAELQAREAAQWPIEMKKARADAILLNDSSPLELQKQIDCLLRGWQILPE